MVVRLLMRLCLCLPPSGRSGRVLQPRWVVVGAGWGCWGRSPVRSITYAHLPHAAWFMVTVVSGGGRTYDYEYSLPSLH